MARLDVDAYQFPLVVMLFIVPPVLLLLLLHLLASSSSSRRRGGCNDDGNKALPPSPPSLPIIGHLHLVGALPHVSLRDLAAEHAAGGLMLLRLGTVPNLVVSSPRAAREVLRTHDHVFASRPASSVAHTLIYGASDIALAPYGHHWRQARKLVTAHLFTMKKVQSYRHAREQEVSLVMAKIRDAAAAAVDLSEMMNTFANDVVCRAVSGKFFREEGRNKLFRELVDANSLLLGGFNLEDYFPGLANSRIGRLLLTSRLLLRDRAHETHKKWDELLETIISDHERRNTNSSMMTHRHYDQEEDFTDVLLSVQQEYGITRDHIKAILFDMFGAGTDTSSLVLELAMTELMRNPQHMTKLQGEVRKHTPEGQETVEEENLSTMAYLRAVVKETLRLHQPTPLLLPHLSMADCVVDGYLVPSGTRVIVNAWAIARDPESWQNPDEFMPERFMEGGSAVAIDFKGNDFEFLPFGAGRRICPGLNFGLATVEIMLANLVYCFDWQLPDGKDVLDMTEVFGLTVRPKEKLMLYPKPRGGTAAACAGGRSLGAS